MYFKATAYMTAKKGAWQEIFDRKGIEETHPVYIWKNVPNSSKSNILHR